MLQYLQVWNVLPNSVELGDTRSQLSQSGGWDKEGLYLYRCLKFSAKKKKGEQTSCVGESHFQVQVTLKGWRLGRNLMKV